MTLHTARIEWHAGAGENFKAGKYSRAHSWSFDGGVTVPASASPHVVPLPYARADAVDPEEALVASASSCHMLTFVWLAQRKGFVIASYVDEASGLMEKDARGKLAITRITLRPRIEWVGAPPGKAELDALHHAAHEECFIASSIRSEILVEG